MRNRIPCNVGIRIRGGSILAVAAVCSAAAGCASVAGLDDLEVVQPGSQDSSVQPESGGDAGSAGDASHPPEGGDVKVDPSSEAAKDATQDPDGATDAVIGPDADGSAEADGGCTNEQKVCNGVCVSVTSPTTGCSNPSCDPCQITHGTAACGGNGTCTVAGCEPGFDDCDKDPSTGCETNLQGDPNNCHSCGNQCPSSGGTPVCNGGQCGVSSCDKDLGDCDNNPGNGCETNLTSSVSNCGFCGNACLLQNAAPVCSASVCKVGSCNASYSDCDGVAANGCEINTGSNLAHCGACNNLCSLAHATAACVSSVCAIGSCDIGWGDCDSMAANGCESDTSSSTTNCGACFNKCEIPNALSVCSIGVCKFSMCTPGYDDCNKLTSDGCESQLISDPANCGVCGHSCLGGTCTGGKCNPVAIATGQTGPWSIATNGSHVYWDNRGSGGGSVMRVGVGGGVVQTLASNQASPDGLAIDTTSVYWCNTADGSIRSVALGGGPPFVLANASPNGPAGLAVSGSFVYFANYGLDSIQRVSTTGGTPQDVSWLNNNKPSRVVTDGVREWHTNSGNGTVRTATVTGSGWTTIASGQANPVGLALDSGFVYWTNQGDHTVARIDSMGTGIVTILVTGQQNPQGIAVDSTHVYWVNFTALGSVRRAPKAGGVAETLATVQQNPAWIALDAVSIYWTNNGSGTVMRLAK